MSLGVSKWWQPAALTGTAQCHESLLQELGLIFIHLEGKRFGN